MSESLPWRIRQARVADLASIACLEAVIWKEMAVDQATLTKRFRRFPAGFLVAEDEHSLGGFCMALRVTPEDLAVDRIGTMGFNRHRTDGPVLFLLGLTVDPLFRRRGIGMALARAEVELAITLFSESVQLIANAYSLNLFSRIGFRAVRKLEGTLFDGVAKLMPAPTQMILSL